MPFINFVVSLTCTFGTTIGWRSHLMVVHSIFIRQTGCAVPTKLLQYKSAPMQHTNLNSVSVTTQRKLNAYSSVWCKKLFLIIHD
jgi:hypothetical protein